MAALNSGGEATTSRRDSTTKRRRSVAETATQRTQALGAPTLRDAVQAATHGDGLSVLVAAISHAGAVSSVSAPLSVDLTPPEIGGVSTAETRDGCIAT